MQEIEKPVNPQTQSYSGGLNYDHPAGLVIKTPIRGFDHKGRVIDGLTVCMYKDRPGEYLAENGRPVPPELARLAGFDVDADLAAKKRREYVKQLSENYDRDQAEARDPAKRKVVASEGGIDLIDCGQDKHLLIDAADGYDLTQGHYLTLEDAMKQLGLFKPEPERSEASDESGEKK